MVKLRLRLQKPKVRELDLPYPVITLSSWVTYLLKHAPQYALAGYNLEQRDQFTSVFHTFWQRYRSIDPLHPVYVNFAPADYGRIIPFALHGDEGRGVAKIPVLVVAFQFVISVLGVNKTNMSGLLCFNCSSLSVPFFGLVYMPLVGCECLNLFGFFSAHVWFSQGILLCFGLSHAWLLPGCMRKMMLPIIPSMKCWLQIATLCFLMASRQRHPVCLVPNFDHTFSHQTCSRGYFQERVFTLQIFWIHLCCQLCSEGPICFHLAFTALKGDWPYLRKAAGLISGFASLRKCHWCTFPASCLSNDVFMI